MRTQPTRASRVTGCQSARVTDRGPPSQAGQTTRAGAAARARWRGGDATATRVLKAGRPVARPLQTLPAGRRQLGWAVPGYEISHRVPERQAGQSAARTLPTPLLPGPRPNNRGPGRTPTRHPTKQLRKEKTMGEVHTKARNGLKLMKVTGAT